MNTEIKGDNPVTTIILISAYNEQNEVIFNTVAVMLRCLFPTEHAQFIS